MIENYSPTYHPLRRCLTLAAIVLISALTAFAQSVISFPGDRSASVAVIVRDLATGEDLVSQNPHHSMLPASTMKCITTAGGMEAGLDTLRFVTRGLVRGEIDSAGVLHGNILLQGTGDPTIESAYFPSNPSFLNQLVEAIKGEGITEIEGNIEVDSSLFPDGGPNGRWELGDLSYDYGAGLFALNYRNNAVGNRAMRDPQSAFADALDNKLMANGIAVAWDELDIDSVPSREICIHESPLGSEIMHSLMIRSDNLFAEGMQRFIAPGLTQEEAIKRERKLLAAKDILLEDVDIYDGSGLARVNRVTASSMADMLQKMADKRGRDIAYTDLFPRVGLEGTVKGLLTNTPLAGKLALKSGSLSGVQCFAGYKFGEDGKPTHLVVILVNDFRCARQHVKSAIESFLKKTFTD